MSEYKYWQIWSNTLWHEEQIYMEEIAFEEEQNVCFCGGGQVYYYNTGAPDV